MRIAGCALNEKFSISHDSLIGTAAIECMQMLLARNMVQKILTLLCETSLGEKYFGCELVHRCHR